MILLEKRVFGVMGKAGVRIVRRGEECCDEEEKIQWNREYSEWDF